MTTRVTLDLLPASLRYPIVVIVAVLGFMFIGMGLQRIAAWIDGPPQNVCIYLKNVMVCGPPA
jgi:hypothetical protein